jgi:diaminohydroxyphosphoribosylaminopyrimidine deaminase/5-amino-6-(5-phosphoribosylamino)uracil reductase
VVVGQRSVPAGARVRLADPPHRFLGIPTRDPRFALEQLFRRDVHSVLLEGGPTLARAFLRADLVDRVTWYTSPALLGAGTAAVPPLGITNIGSALRFALVDVRRVGGDVRLDLEPSRTAQQGEEEV